MNIKSHHHRSYDPVSCGDSLPIYRPKGSHSYSRTSPKFTDIRGRFKLLSPRSPRFVPRYMIHCNVDSLDYDIIVSHYNDVKDNIRDVWNSNLEQEFKKIRSIVQTYHYIAMDTKFMSTAAPATGENGESLEFSYKLLRCNVDLLRITQLGLTFMDEDGNTPPGFSTWQFNFKLELETIFTMDSIELLQFQRNKSDGIDAQAFAELVMMSGIVLVDDIKFVCFDSAYDFGYLIKLLTNQELPETEAEYKELVQTYFPEIYDTKYLLNAYLKCDLQQVAEELKLRHIKKQRQAGCGALLTGRAFFKMRTLSDVHFEPTPIYFDHHADNIIEH